MDFAEVWKIQEQIKHLKNHHRFIRIYTFNLFREVNILKIRILFHAFTVILWELSHELNSTQKDINILPKCMP